MDGTGAVLAATALLMTLLAATWHRGIRISRRPPGRRGTARTRMEWEGDYALGFQRALDVLQALDGEIVAADPNRGTITARMRPSAVSPAPLGALAHVFLTTRDGITFVDLEVVPALRVVGSRGAAEVGSRFTAAWERLPGPTSPAMR